MVALKSTIQKANTQFITTLGIVKTVFGTISFALTRHPVATYT
jgi:hypothetical protein